MQNIFLPEKQMIMIPFNCNLMRHNLFFKVIYTRCVLRKLAQPNPSAFLWEKKKNLKLAGDCFHSYKLYLFVVVEVGGIKGNLQCSHIYYNIPLKVTQRTKIAFII